MSGSDTNQSMNETNEPQEKPAAETQTSSKKNAPLASGVSRRRFMARTAMAAGGTAAALAVAGCRTSRLQAAPNIIPARAIGANDRIGVGVIGTGGRGGSHIGAVSWLKEHGGRNVEIVALCDTYRPRLQVQADNTGARTYESHSELLQDPDVDVVCIATPDHHHAYQTIDAVRAGKHVYCEKPISHWSQFELTRDMAREVRRSGCVFQAGTQRMASPAWRQARGLIEDGLIGRVIHAECEYFRVGDWGEFGMPIPDANARPGPDLNWEAFLGDAPKRPYDVSRYFRWRMYEDYAGGPVTDLYPHFLTQTILLAGVGMPELVMAAGGIYRYDERREVPDTFDMIVQYPEEVNIVMKGSQASDFNYCESMPIIRGTEGTLHFNGFREIVFTPVHGTDRKPQTFPIEAAFTDVDYWTQFLDCIRRGDPATPSDIDLSWRTQAPCQMAYLALKNRTVVRYDASRERMVL